MYELKLKLPASSFEIGEHSAAYCGSEECMIDGKFAGNPFGIYLSEDEIKLCKSKSIISKCVIFLALQLNSLTSEEVSINVSFVNSGCRTMVEDGWSGSHCHMDKYESNLITTKCVCQQPAPKFTAATDMVIPPQKIDFDQLFIDPCEKCAAVVIVYVVFILTLWLFLLQWTTVNNS